MAEKTPKNFDLCVIGCGPGGFAGAMRALDLGKHVCIVEGGEIGGAGVMWGALSSKTLWELAKDYAIAAKIDRGYRAAGLTVDYQSVRDTVLQAVKEKQYQLLSQIETFSPRRWQGPGSLNLKRGWAAFHSPDSLEVSADSSDVEIVGAENFLIASGSKPKTFSGIEIDGERILTSDDVLNLKSFPKRLVIIGAGIIGCEYAAIFSNFGQSQVYLVDYMDRVIPYEDDDISFFVSRNLEENGVKILHSAILKEVIHKPDHLAVVLDFDDGHTQVLETDAVLISIGREPNLSSLKLENAGIQMDDNGALRTDNACRVTGRIFAGGDVTRHPALVNLAEMECRHAIEEMFGQNPQPLNYSNMSTVMFFKPAVAAVGLNEKACQRQKIAYRVAYYSNALLPRAIAMRATTGFVKIIVSDDEDMRLLGMRSAGPQVSNTIMTVAMLMDQGKGLRDALKTIHPHPTMSEIIQECLRLLLGDSIFKAQAFPQQIKIKVWHPDIGFKA